MHSFSLFLEHMPPLSLNPEPGGELLVGGSGGPHFSFPTNAWPAANRREHSCLENASTQDVWVECPNRLHFQNCPDLALWNIHLVVEVSRAFKILQLVEIRAGEDPAGHRDRPSPPSRRALSPQGTQRRRRNSFSYDYYFRSSPSSTECFSD